MSFKSYAQKLCFHKTSHRLLSSRPASHLLHHLWKTVQCYLVLSSVRCPRIEPPGGHHHRPSAARIPLLVVAPNPLPHCSCNSVLDSTMTGERRLVARLHCHIQQATRRHCSQVTRSMLRVRQVCELLQTPSRRSSSRKLHQHLLEHRKRALQLRNAKSLQVQRLQIHPARDHKQLGLKRMTLYVICFPDTISVEVRSLTSRHHHQTPRTLVPRRCFVYRDAGKALAGFLRSASVMAPSSGLWMS
jgi:hypothetical protein